MGRVSCSKFRLSRKRSDRCPIKTTLLCFHCSNNVSSICNAYLMSTFDEHGISGRLTIEKARVWDLRTTGQVTSGNRTTAGISCVCFHPTEPTLCVVRENSIKAFLERVCQVTVQGSFSVLSFYNAHSGGKMSTVQLQSVVSAAEFTKDGSRIVAIFRVWK